MKKIIAIVLLIYSNVYAQNEPAAIDSKIENGKFSNHKLPQTLKKIGTTKSQETYLDLNRIIINKDGSITAESIDEMFQPQPDNTKSYAVVLTFYCAEEDEKKFSWVEYYKYTGSKKTGDLIGGKTIINSPKQTINEKTIPESLFNELCAHYIAAKEAVNKEAQRIENERKRQEFANSPEGKRQAAKAAEEERQRQAQERQRQAQERQRQAQLAKEFPFYAVISCGNNYNGNFQAFICFNGNHNVHTELEVRNGSTYNMYTFMDIMQMPADKGSLVIDLRQNFDLKMQNASDSFLLNLKIYNRANQKIIFEKSASHYGVIRISN